MDWDQIIGQDYVIEMLKSSIAENRISHAQLFIGKDGFGTLPLALAYATEVLAKENPKSKHKIENLNHLDLHFSFPTYKAANVDALSSNYRNEWRDMLLENPYASYEDWIEKLDSEKKQLFISVAEIQAVINEFTLKSFEGGSKILIFFRIEKMRADSANKFLKFLEEPPKDTIILMTAESSDFILPTILSRCQSIHLPRLDNHSVENALTERFHVSDEHAKTIAFEAQGEWNLARKLAEETSAESEFESYFIQWVRNAFQAKTKVAVLQNILQWAQEIAAWSREKQVRFLDYCAGIFRLALLENYGAGEMVYKRIKRDNFKWSGFSRFIHGANIEAILSEISTTNLHIMRNGNGKIVWTDMGIKLTRYIHRSAS